jgi:hypothetical protein
MSCASFASSLFCFAAYRATHSFEYLGTAASASSSRMDAIAEAGSVCFLVAICRYRYKCAWIGPKAVPGERIFRQSPKRKRNQNNGDRFEHVGLSYGSDRTRYRIDIGSAYANAIARARATNNAAVEEKITGKNGFFRSVSLSSMAQNYMRRSRLAVPHCSV